MSFYPRSEREVSLGIFQDLSERAHWHVDSKAFIAIDEPAVQHAPRRAGRALECLYTLGPNSVTWLLRAR